MNARPGGSPGRAQPLAWAERARRQPDQATTDAARAIHLTLAQDYEARAAEARGA